MGPTGAPERPSMAAPAREWGRGEGPGRRALRLWRLSADICASRAELWFGLGELAWGAALLAPYQTITHVNLGGVQGGRRSSEPR